MSIDYSGFAFPKPGKSAKPAPSKSRFQKPADREGKITLSPGARRKLLDKLCAKQKNRCARCRCEMTRITGELNTATLGHDRPEPMGCKKRDNPDNLNKAICWRCNMVQGSKRL